MSNFTGGTAPFAPSQGHPDEWVSFAFDLKNLGRPIAYTAIFLLIVELVRTAISGGLIFHLVTGVVILAIISGGLAFGYRRSQKVSINLTRNEIKLGDDTFNLNQVDLLNIRATTRDAGFTPNFVIGANGKSSVITLGKGGQNKILSSEQYLVLRTAVQRFHIPDSYQGVNQVKGRTITNTIGKAEATQTINLYL